MAIITKAFGWIELAIALLAAYICGKGIFALATSDPNDMTLEWAPLVVALALPISLSLAWGGWHLVKRQDWLHQAAPFFVIFAVASFLFAIEY
jgi:flagellar biosynthesis protein FliQ